MSGLSLRPERLAPWWAAMAILPLPAPFRTTAERAPIQLEIPVCAWCGRVQMAGRWLSVCLPRAVHSDPKRMPHASHGICPTCREEVFGRNQREAA